uniref:FYVE-type domain-containing protein n=1 Tax=Callorhinchus milii TaxID=7868 RepID=A0A4W3GDV4_CALMI
AKPTHISAIALPIGGSGEHFAFTAAGGEGEGLLARRFAEAAESTLHAVSSVVDYPLGFVKEAARPEYWVPDHQMVKCHHCEKAFTPDTPKHHCRCCGEGFCTDCSGSQRSVPSRGWDHPVRVCVGCNEKKGDL